MWLKDTDGKPSVTLTAFVAGFGLACFKLIFSGMSFGSFTLAPFSGGDFAAVVGAVGALYWARRNVSSDGSKAE